MLFPEDVNITCKTLEVVLDKSKYAVEDVVAELRNKSLIGSAYNHEIECYVYGIHTLLLNYLKATVDPKKIQEMHKQLVERYLKAAQNNYAKLPNDNYIYTYLGHHLREAGMIDKFADIYFDLHFLAAKVRAAGVADLLLDITRYKNYITRNRHHELEHRLEACERFVHDHGQQLCDRPSLDVVQLGLLSHDLEMRQLAESAVVGSPERLYLRQRTAGDPRGSNFGEGILCDEAPHTPALDLGENVRAACFAHHANLVLVGGADGRVRMWNHGYRSAEHEYHGHRDAAVSKLEVASEQTCFLSLADNGQVKIWSLDQLSTSGCGVNNHESGPSSDECVPSPRVRQPNWVNPFEGSTGSSGDRPSDTSCLFQLMDDSIISASFSKWKDSLLVVGSKGGQVIVWDIESNERIFEDKKQKPVCACALAGHDQLIVFAVDNLVYVYNLKSREYLSHLVDEPEIRQLLVVESDSSEEGRIIVRSRRVLSFWSWKVKRSEGDRLGLVSPTRTLLAQMEESNDEYTCAAVTWDGLYLVAGTLSGALLMWSLNDNNAACTIRELAPPGVASALCLDTFLDEESNSNVVYVLLSGGGDGRVRRWHVSPSPVTSSSDAGSEVSLSGIFAARWIDSGAPLVAAATEDYRVRVYVGCSLVAESPTNSRSPTRLAISPDCRSIAIGLSNGLVCIFDYRTKQQQSVMHLAGKVTYLEYMSGEDINDCVLVSGTADGCMMCAVKSRCLRLQSGGAALISAWMIRASLLTASSDGCVKLWELRGGELSDVLVAANTGSLVSSAAMSLQRDRLCIARSNGRLSVYALTVEQSTSGVSCTFRHERCVSETALTACQWSNDGKRVAAGAADGHVAVMSVGVAAELGEPVRLQKEHQGPVTALTWSPPPGGGAPLALLSAGDRTLVWWDVGRAAELGAVATGAGGRRRSAARRSRPDPLDLGGLEPALPSLLSDPAWRGKSGPPLHPHLLAAVPARGELHHVVVSPDFTRFVSVDSAGVLHLLSLLRPGHQDPLTPSPT